MKNLTRYFSVVSKVTNYYMNILAHFFNRTGRIL